MDNQILDFYKEIYKLKTLVRSGWARRKMNLERKGSVAEHCFSMGLLCVAVIEKFKLKLDVAKVLKLTLIHELGEIDVGDITPSDNVPWREKHNRELAGVKRVANVLGDDSIVDLWLEFEEKKTEESIFVNEMDKLDAIMQAKIYSEKLNEKQLFDEFFNNGKNKIGKYISILKSENEK